MGALHEGHLSLIAASRGRCDLTVVSVFVNPTQFGPGEDYRRYPRTLRRDAALCHKAGVDLIFVPSVDTIYPPGDTVRVDVGPLGAVLEGASRPGHFNGVATVVLKLLNLVQPDRLFLGQKDYQQTLVIKQLVRSFHLDVDVIVCPTIREADGLAMSSRNRYLDAAQRRQAPELHASLARLAEAVRAGRRDYGALEGQALEDLKRAGFRPDYVEVRRAADLAKPGAADRADDLVVLGTAWLGRARLIDNLRI